MLAPTLRSLALMLFVWLAVAWPGQANAETVKVSSTTTLRSRPSESARAIAKISGGTSVTVLATDGSWTKVRGSGRTGWVPSRALGRKAAAKEPSDKERKQRERDAKRREEARQKDQDRKSARDRKRERDDERELTEIAERDRLEREAREQREAQAAEDDQDSPTDEKDNEETSTDQNYKSRGFWQRLSVDLRIGGGLTHMGQSLSSFGAPAGVPDNYTVTAGAGTFGTKVEALYAVGSGNNELGGSVEFVIGRSLSGLRYLNAQTAFSSMALDLAVTGRHRFSSGVHGLARVGYRERRFDIDGGTNAFINPALIASESLRGLLVGLSLEIPQLAPRIGLRLDFDFIPTATLVQTAGLEDGLDPVSRGAHLRVSARYYVRPRIAVEVSYDQDRVVAKFGADVPGSMRAHGGLNTARNDVNHTFSLSLASSL